MSKKILIVDDDKIMTDVLHMSLTHSGFAADVANTMAEATQLLSTSFYDAVLLDQQGGDIDRPRIAGAARASGSRVISMSGDITLRPELDKPFTRDQLIACLSRNGISSNNK